MERFEVIVIGSGQGGNPFAQEAAKRGKKTALIEHGPFGGTCINTGCTPTKTMIASGRVAYLARRGEDYGVQAGAVSVDMAKVRDRKRELVANFSVSTEKSDESTVNLELIRETAHFTGPKSLAAGGRELTAEIIVIDTGSKPAIPDIPGLQSVPYLDSTSVMELDHVPERLLVLGAGYIGLEFAQLYQRLGSVVTVLERSPRFLPKEDEDIADEMANVLRAEGAEIFTGVETRQISSVRGGIRLEVVVNGTHKSFEGDELLVALGRQPNTESLDLGNSGIETSPKGAIVVNDRLETNVPGVYGIGDVNGGPQFTHISYDDFRILRDNLFEGKNRTTRDRLVPYVVFTDPQLGRVGLSEQEAKSRGTAHKVCKIPMASVARALENDESRGFMKAIVETDSGRILGAAVLGLEGGELLNMIQIAMMGGLSAKDLYNGIFSHPTLGESLNNLFG